MALELAALIGSDKTLAIEPNWAERDSEGLAIICPLEIGGVTIEGLQFRATAKKRLPEEMVTLQVEYHPPAELGGPLCRLEWRPISAHNNKGRGPIEWQHRLIRGCHYHPFDVNMEFAEKELRQGNLPIALPLADSPVNFDGLLVLVKKEFRINNIELVRAPPWEPTLL
jgi:hypothetical protein